MYKLYVKTHMRTGKKYLGMTTKDDPYTYKGSGKHWKRHLKVHGNDVWTNVLFQTEMQDELVDRGIYYSTLWDVVDSTEWLNLRAEDGDGGDTVSSKRWITDGKIDTYLDKDEPLPIGWSYGRTNCVFGDPTKQSKFSLKVDRKRRGESLKKMWSDGSFIRDHSKCGKVGDGNPAKRLEVRQKISEWQFNKEPEYCEQCDKWFKALGVHLNRSKEHNGNIKN